MWHFEYSIAPGQDLLYLSIRTYLRLTIIIALRVYYIVLYCWNNVWFSLKYLNMQVEKMYLVLVQV